MSQLEVNISKSNQNVSTITKVVDENSITSLLGALQKAKDESNDFLTSLVEKDKLKTAAVKDRKDVKRKSCEALEGGKGAKIPATGCDLDEDDGEGVDDQDEE